jgi:hypothetical protein
MGLSNYPGALDAFTDPGAGDTMDGDQGTNTALYHDVQHSLLNDAVAALEATLGITGSAVTTSITYQLAHIPAASITSGQIALARGGTGADLSATGGANQFVRQSSAGGVFTVSAIASADIATALLTPGPIGSTTANSGAFTTVSATGQITSTLATGTAPLVVSSTTVVNNLNVSQLLGATWASPAAIGSTTPAAGTFTNVTDSAISSGQVVFAGTGGLLSGNAGFTFQETISASGQGLHIDCVSTATSGGLYAGHFENRYEPSGATTGTFVALDALCSVSNGGAFAANGGVLIGLVGETRIETGSTGTFATAYGAQLSVNNQSAATITTAYALYFPAPQNSGGGSIGTFAAIEIDALSGATTNYAILTGGAGLVKIQDATASSSTTTGALVVTGGIGVGGALQVGGNTTLRGSSGNFIIPSAVSTGAQTNLQITSAVNTGQTASTEINSVLFNLSATRTWATGAITTQREFLIQAPTYAFAVASTITTAATVAISGAPVAGTNATLTSTYALWVQGGEAHFASQITGTGSNCLVLTQAATSSGINTVLNMVGAVQTGVTSGTEQNDINFGLNRTVTWATSTPTTQRAFLIQAPTYACDTASQTITTAATVYITGGPIAGTNVTITNRYALYVAGQQSYFAGAVTVGGTLTMGDAQNINIGSTTGTKIGIATNQKIGFWNVTPVVQPATTGTTTGFTAGSGTAMNSASTSTGGTGSSAYTFGDVVLALKQIGLMAA